MAIPALDPETVAREIGAQGIDHLVANAEKICAYESERIELTNQGPIASLVEQHRHLVAEEDRIATLLRGAPPSGDRLRLLRRAIFCWVLALLEALSGFALTILTLAPYRLGSKTWLYAIGVSVLTPFLIDELLSHWPTLVKFLTPLAAAAGIAGVMLFAAIRGNLLGEELHENQASAVVIDNTDPQEQPQSDFYQSTVPSLRMAFLLLAFSIEIGSGIALFEARRSRSDQSQDWNALRRELREIRVQKAGVMRGAIDLRNEPAIFAARFHRDFYRAMLTNAVHRALTRALLVAIGVSSFVASKAYAAQKNLDMVIAIDLTASVAVAGPDGKSEFQKDVDGVTRVLAQVPPGTHVTVIGLTDASFSQPYILMQAQVGNNPGYFGERLTAARNQMVRAWELRSARLEPHFRHTDILGALMLASQIFAEEEASRKDLIVFSDMRQDTAELNLESSAAAAASVAITRMVIPDLHDVQVNVLGVDGAGQSTRDWRNIEAFWSEYFHHAGAGFRLYSALRELPGPP